LVKIKGGDDRFYNNLFVGNGQPASNQPTGKNLEWISSYGLWGYDTRDLPLCVGGNVFYSWAQPYAKETNATVLADNPKVKLVAQNDHLFLQLTVGKELEQANTSLVTTARLGSAAIPSLPYQNPDGTPLQIDTDYLANRRSPTNPTPGPFENPGTGSLRIKVW
jgi:hypothetical protein